MKINEAKTMRVPYGRISLIHTVMCKRAHRISRCSLDRAEETIGQMQESTPLLIDANGLA